MQSSRGIIPIYRPRPLRVQPLLQLSATQRSSPTAAPNDPQRSKRSLPAYEVGELAVSKGLQDAYGVLGPSPTNKSVGGKTDLAEFIINRGEKVVNQVLKVGQMNNDFPL